MPKTPTSRKITRRDAVALLGAGTMMTVVRPARAGAPQPNHPSCDTPSTVDAYTGSTKTSQQAIVSFSCCEETKNAILVGVEEQGHRPTARGKTHLKPLRDRLANDTLLEYCLMIWGLSQTDAKKLYESVPAQLGLKVTKRAISK